MPELPEVEIHARYLRDWLDGKSIAGYTVYDPKLLDGANRSLWNAALQNSRVLAVRRTAKYLLIDLTDTPEGDDLPRWTLVIHLRMTGKVVYDTYVAGEPSRWTRLSLRLTEGGTPAGQLRFEDIRRFGRVWVVPIDQVHELPEIASLGPDALQEPTSAERLKELCAGVRRPIKVLLMDQTALGGLGNICAIEVLHRVGVSPATPACQVPEVSLDAIARAIPEYLEWAIAAQERRKLIYLGEPGAVNVFGVYARAGEPCPRCGETIVRTVLGGRGTFHCPTCQPSQEEAIATIPATKGKASGKRSVKRSPDPVAVLPPDE